MIYLSENIRHLRKLKQLSQKDLEVNLELKRGNLTSYENGRTSPDYNTLIKISDFFNTSIDTLLKKDLKNELTHDFIKKIETVEIQKPVVTETDIAKLQMENAHLKSENDILRQLTKSLQENLKKEQTK